MPSKRLLLPVAVGLAALYALGFASAYDQRVLTLAGVFALLVLGYHLVFGHAGALNLAQGAFFGLGAYVTGILGSLWGGAFVITFPLSIAAPALLAAITGRVVLRLQTHYFALATLALAQLLLVIAVNWQSVTGGANGIVGVPGVTLFGHPIRPGTPLLVLVWITVALGAFALHRYLGGARRPAFALAAAAPLTAATTGIDTATERFAAFVIAAAFAGAAGAFYAHTLRVLSPDVLGFTIMVSCLAMTVIGGRKSIAGAIIGAVLLTILPELLRPLQAYYLAATGGATLLTVIFAPLGLAGLLTARARPDPPPPPTRRPDQTAPSHPAPNGAALSATGISKAFGGVIALDGVSLSLNHGEVVGLIGPNGSGKTTLVNVITGIEKPDAGAITLAGQNLIGLPAHRIAAAGISRSFQTPEAPDDLTARDIVALAHAHTTSHVWPHAQAAAAADLAAVGLADVASTTTPALPHGQRLFIDAVRALAGRPRIVFLDEPAAGLSDLERQAMAALITKAAAGGTAVVVIEHNLDFLDGLAHRLVCLDQGRVVADGPTAATIDSSAVRHAYHGVAS